MICALLACTPGLAQDALVTDRPDTTESALVVPRGAWQIETGVRSARENDGADIDVLELFNSLLRVGITDQLELRVGFDGYVDIDAGAADGDGLGDTSVGVKFELASERGRNPDAALIVGTKLPTGDGEIGSPRPDPFAIAAFSNTLSENVSLGYNVGLAASSSEEPDGDEETDVVALASASFGFALSERVGLFTEVFGRTEMTSGGETPVAFDAGLTWLVRPRLQLDAFVGTGLTSDAPDFFFGFGVSFRTGG